MRNQRIHSYNFFYLNYFWIYFVIVYFPITVLAEDEPKVIVEELKGYVNTRFQEFSPSLSPDGNTLYFYSKKDRASYTDIFYSKKLPNGLWDYPKELEELNSDYDDQSPYMTVDGRYLFFSSNREGSQETRLEDGRIGVSRDLYYAEYKDGKWSEIYTFSDEINTPMIEENPHFHNGVLLFTRYPFGKPEFAKIYSCIYDPEKGWGKPKILPSPVNDAYATIAASLSHDGKTLYFASNRPGGLGGFDIYSVAWDGTKPVGQAENLGADINSSGDEAYFVFHQPTKTILFARREPGKDFNIYTAYIQKPSIQEKLEKDQKVVLNSIHFEVGSYELLPDSFSQLDEIANFLKTKKSIKMKIVGHTDLNGNMQDNMVLSLNRAKEVRKYLVQRGIEESRLEVEGKGSSEPLFPSKDETASAKNRRTEFFILSE